MRIRSTVRKRMSIDLWASIINDMIRPHFVLYYPLNQTLFSTTVEPVLQNRVADLPVEAAALRGIEYESSEFQYSNLLFTLFQDVLFEILFWYIVCILPEAVLYHYSAQQAFTPRQFEVFSYNLANPSPAEVLADFK